MKRTGSGVFRGAILLAVLAALLLSLSAPALADDGCVSQIYRDVPPYGHWAHDGIDYCIYNGLMNGVDDTSFDPNGETTRVQFVTILYRLAGSPEAPYRGLFSDVGEDKWFAGAVEWAAENGIASGVGEDCFVPDRTITLEEMVLMLYRFSGSPKPRGDLRAFADAEELHPYAVAAMTWAVENGIVNGSESENGLLLNGLVKTTRAQVATSVMRIAKMTCPEVPENDTVVGHLEHEGQVEWFTFEMREPGAVYFSYGGSLEYDDGVPSHWGMLIYDQDRETVLSETYVGAYARMAETPPIRAWRSWTRGPTTSAFTRPHRATLL